MVHSYQICSRGTTCVLNGTRSHPFFSNYKTLALHLSFPLVKLLKSIPTTPLQLEISGKTKIERWLGTSQSTPFQQSAQLIRFGECSPLQTSGILSLKINICHISLSLHGFILNRLPPRHIFGKISLQQKTGSCVVFVGSQGRATLTLGRDNIFGGKGLLTHPSYY